MPRIIKPALIFCLLLSLFAVGCSDKDKTQVPNNNIIYAPVDPSLETTPEDTETEPQDSESADETAHTTQTPSMVDPEPTPIPVPDPVPNPTPETPTPDTAETIITDITGTDSSPVDLTDALLSNEAISGRLISDQSEKLRLVINYDCSMNSMGFITFIFDVGLECYDIDCGARTDMGELTINGSSHKFSTDPISNSSGTKIYVPFTSYTYTCDAEATSCTVDASWAFNGVYGGIKIDKLTAGAVFTWGEPTTVPVP